ncbi:DegT/DnrJ/EryC1/StrS family aminotransferase [Candidatus Haliotispira prima]|uniref:DegT/DnrJ/EryC1/StrS family aminotransferase n=1 Tax=Candidatus Haliotispira prima TaxID=3034016 RepID=A0ABY8MGV8_9SPIO|nr:DegT/DnrJ/EryC1/StrS family aminotransferase [Candidatus Haliotispira prima]
MSIQPVSKELDSNGPFLQNVVMQFIDLQRQQEQISDSVRRNIAEVLEHGKYINGPEVPLLEKEMEGLLQGEVHAIACGNGTDAIQVACMALGLQPGDEVITTPLSFMATVEVPVLLHLKVVFIEVDPETGNLDPAGLEAAITPRTKLILPVSLYGRCANYTKIVDIAAQHGIPVLEDGAESFGAKHRGRLSCTMTDLATTSFFPAKPLGCYGDGGMVFVRKTAIAGPSDTGALAAGIRRICRHGQRARYRHTEIGVNSRLDTLQAAILLAKLEVLETEHRKKQEIARHYCDALRGKIGLMETQNDDESAHGYFPILVEHRDAMLRALETAQIPYSLHFPCLHTQTAISGKDIDLGYREGDFPIAERIAREVITIPMHAYLTEAETEQVISCILQNS